MKDYASNPKANFDYDVLKPLRQVSFWPPRGQSDQDHITKARCQDDQRQSNARRRDRHAVPTQEYARRL
jgi:hypothetical protein